MLCKYQNECKFDHFPFAFQNTMNFWISGELCEKNPSECARFAYSEKFGRPAPFELHPLRKDKLAEYEQNLPSFRNPLTA